MVVENVNGTELRFKNPGSLLLVVIGFILWGVGFLDLLGHTSAEPDIFGLYSFPFFLFIILYGCTIAVWIILFFNANLLLRVLDGVRYIQNRTALVVPALIGLGIALWLVFEWDRWARLPALQFSAFGLIVLTALILVFTDWNEKNGQQVWRRVIAYPLIALLALEVILQITAWFGVLPGVQTIGGNFYPYERIYQNGEDPRNDFANRYGWYSPDATLDNGKKRILIVGGSYVQALEVQPDQHASVYLSERINQGQTDRAMQTEVIPIGMPGFGLSAFLYEDTMIELPDTLDFDEMVILFHLGDDFQSPVDADNSLRYVVRDGTVAVHPEDARLRHDLTHYYLRGFMSFQLVGTIRSNYLTPRVIKSLFDGSDGETRRAESAGDDGFDFPRLVGSVEDYYAITEPGHAGIKTTDLQIISNGNNFIFEEGGNEGVKDAVAIANGILATAQEIASARGSTLRIVTIPVFPQAFYEAYEGDDWEPQVGEYDLFLPEQELTVVAQNLGIPILPMGQYMLDDGLSASEIKALYLSAGRPSFTPQGQKYFADAIYSCFYSDEANGLCSR